MLSALITLHAWKVEVMSSERRTRTSERDDVPSSSLAYVRRGVVGDWLVTLAGGGRADSDDGDGEGSDVGDWEGFDDGDGVGSDSNGVGTDDGGGKRALMMVMERAVMLVTGKE